jgi:serine/threonine protein kinase
MTEPEPRTQAAGRPPSENRDPTRDESAPMDRTGALHFATESAPPFRAMLPNPPTETTRIDGARSTLKPSEQIGDFILVRLLGSGSFGQVFLARQISLNRLVALKITMQRGDEGRTLARLEHEHIVQVHSEAVNAETGQRLLCMQYVPGITLAQLVKALARRDRHEWSGKAVLEAIDAADTEPVALDIAALRDRELLARSDFIEAVCWIGARLAEALAHAHSLGVLHRDIKPANVLLNRYGRPLLADFNISVGASPGSASSPLGGTLAYMAPEHLVAFARGSDATPDSVREPADIYSLGVVLFEVLTGALPFVAHISRPMPTAEDLITMAAARRSDPPTLPVGADVPGPVAGLLRRCLEPDPAKRYGSADELARDLDGCRELRSIERSTPAAGPITRALLRQPFLMCCVLLLLPHVLSSAVNKSYRALRIVPQLSPEQQEVHSTVVPVYNLVLYAVLVIWAIVLLRPVRKIRQALAGPNPPSLDAVIAARRKALRLPLWVVALSCLGWLPGGIVFPLVIHVWAGPLAAGVFLHFVISCTLSGLIALTYSYFAAQFVVLRFLYQALWTAQPDVKATVRTELAGLDRQLMIFQALAVLIPLTGAILLVMAGRGEGVRTERETFRLLVTALIVAGMVGLGVTFAVGRLLQETHRAMTGDERR